MAPKWLLGGRHIFVISGYVVASSAATFSNQSLLVFCVEFYKRRIKRLVPPLLIVALATILTILVLVPPEAGKLSALRTVLYSIAGLSNIFLAGESTDYWHDPIMPNPFLHSWSLGVEAQFYFVFPLIFFFLADKEKKFFTQSTRVILISFLATSSLLFSVWQDNSSPINAFYQISGRMWEPLLGVLTYFTLHTWKEELPVLSMRSQLRASIIYSTPLIAIAVLLIIPPDLVATKIAIILACSLTAVIIALGSNGSPPKASNILNMTVFRLAGRVSYSCYLVHWPIITLYSSIIGLASPMDYVRVLSGIVVGSCLIYFFVERNCSGAARGKVGLKKLLFAQTVAIVLAASPGVVAKTKIYQYDYWGVDNWSYGNDWRAYIKSDIASKTVVSHAEHIVTRNIPDIGSTDVVEAAPPLLTQQKLPDTISIFGIGNSFLLSSMPMLIEFSFQNGYDIYTQEIRDCHWHQQIDCDAAITEFKNKIEKSGTRGSLIYLAVRLPQDISSSPLFNKLLPELADLASRRGMLLIIQGAMPVFTDFSPKACFSTIRTRRGEQCQELVSESTAKRSWASNIDRELLELAAKYQNVFVFQPWSAFCKDQVCARGTNGRTFFFMNEDHLSIRGSVRLLPDFAEFIQHLPHQ